MGLDIYLAKTPVDREADLGDWIFNMSYGGFNMLRRGLAIEVGLIFDAMDGCGGDMPWPKDCALEPLLNHSDCDGEMTPDQCAQVAPALRVIYDKWSTSENWGERTWAGAVKRLADGFEKAGKQNLTAVFC